MELTMAPVRSSNVEAVGYDIASRQLHVRFGGGGTYVHHGVSPEAHRQFMAAASKGAYYHQHFRDRFGASRASDR